jgi:adenylate/nucleoside-diphosphate kinase
LNLELPKKLPPKVIPIPIGKLPLVGYLEQSVARSLNNALSAVGNMRPKYPFKNVTQSACEFVALYLKGNIYKRYT